MEWAEPSPVIKNATQEHIEHIFYGTMTGTNFNCLLVELFHLTVECLTVPLWYKQQVSFLNPKFDLIRPKNGTFQPFIRLKTFQNLSYYSVIS